VARHLRVPGIVDVVLVSNPAEIRTLNDHPKIDRNFIPLGPMMNRFIVGRIRRWFEIMGQLLPSLTPRDDRVRVDRQQQLAAALDSEHESSQGSMLWGGCGLGADAGVARVADGDVVQRRRRTRTVPRPPPIDTRRYVDHHGPQRLHCVSQRPRLGLSSLPET